MKVLHYFSFFLLGFSLVFSGDRHLRKRPKTSKYKQYSNLKMGRLRNQIARRFLLKEQDVLGNYILNAEYYISRSLDYRMTWLIFYNLNKINKTYSERKQLKKEFAEAFLKINLYKLKNGDVLKSAMKQFKECYNKEELKIQLLADHKAIIDRVCEPPQNSLSGTMNKFFSLVDNPKQRKVEAKWNLSFDIFTGYKSLTIRKTNILKGVLFYVYYVIPAFSKRFGHSKTYWGNVYLKFDGLFEKKYDFGNFNFEVE